MPEEIDNMDGNVIALLNSGRYPGLLALAVGPDRFRERYEFGGVMSFDEWGDDS